MMGSNVQPETFLEDRLTGHFTGMFLKAPRRRTIGYPPPNIPGKT